MNRTLAAIVTAAAVCHPVALGLPSSNDAAVAITTQPVVAADPRAYVRHVASRSRGWTGRQWDCLTTLIQRESGWRLHAANRHSSARGLFQILHQNPDMSLVQQTRIGLRYIADRHHTPCQALAFHNRHAWY